MAQTWPVSKKRIAALRLVDLVGRAVALPFRRRSTGNTRRAIDRILVIEPWNIGDVVLATPILAALRERYPGARISLLAKSYSRDLLEGSGLVDEIIAADIPWTAQTGKYRLTAGVMRSLRGVLRDLRTRQFDLTLDARMDIRSNLLAAASGAARRIGYDIGGGGWLLTDSIPRNNETHKIDDWLALLGCLDPNGQSNVLQRTRPRLTVSDKEKLDAKKALATWAGDSGPMIGYHPGGSHAGKRWPRAKFAELIAELSADTGGRHAVFLGPDEENFDGLPVGVPVMRPTLRELMALVTCCDVFVSNDSGPMHIADALGVPVVAIFEIGNPQWFGPSGERARVIRGELAGLGLSAAPLDHPPKNPVPVSRVSTAVKEILASNRSLR